MVTRTEIRDSTIGVCASLCLCVPLCICFCMSARLCGSVYVCVCLFCLRVCRSVRVRLYACVWVCPCVCMGFCGSVPVCCVSVCVRALSGRLVISVQKYIRVSCREQRLEATAEPSSRDKKKWQTTQQEKDKVDEKQKNKNNKNSSVASLLCGRYPVG